MVWAVLPHSPALSPSTHGPPTKLSLTTTLGDMVSGLRVRLEAYGDGSGSGRGGAPRANLAPFQHTHPGSRRTRRMVGSDTSERSQGRAEPDLDSSSYQVTLRLSAVGMGVGGSGMVVVVVVSMGVCTLRISSQSITRQVGDELGDVDTFDNVSLAVCWSVVGMCPSVWTPMSTHSIPVKWAARSRSGNVVIITPMLQTMDFPQNLSPVG